MRGEPPDFDDAFRARLHDLLVWRRDVRRFRTERVPDAVLAAAMVAFDLSPSVGNSQPWRIVSIESEEARSAVRANFERCNADALGAVDPDRADLYARLKLEGLEAAPVQFAVFCDMETDQGHGLGRRTMPETLVHSVVGAVTMFALFARAHGLGVGWVSILEPADLERDLCVDAAWSFVSYLCVGYPEYADDIPELEREGWQARAGRAPLLRR